MLPGRTRCQTMPSEKELLVAHVRRSCVPSIHSSLTPRLPTPCFQGPLDTAVFNGNFRRCLKLDDPLRQEVHGALRTSQENQLATPGVERQLRFAERIDEIRAPTTRIVGGEHGLKTELKRLQAEAGIFGADAFAIELEEIWTRVVMGGISTASRSALCAAN